MAVNQLPTFFEHIFFCFAQKKSVNDDRIFFWGELPFIVMLANVEPQKKKE